MLCECYNESDLEALRGLAENVMVLLEAVRVPLEAVRVYRGNECVEAIGQCPSPHPVSS